MKLYFDTLKYAERLQAAGISNPNAQAEALKEALEQNIFNKGEVEKMFTEALQRFDKRTEEIQKRTEEMQKRTYELASQMAIQRAELVTEIHKTAWITIGVISALGTILHFLH